MVCPNGTVLKRPTDAEAGACLGITPDLDPQTLYDVAVVGAGPAGLATAVYAASEGLSVHRAGPARLRRPGRGVGPDRELSRLSHRHLGPGAGRARLQPGAEIRRRDRHPARGGAARLRRRRAAVPARLCAWSSTTDAPCGRAPWSSPPARAIAGRTSRTCRPSRARASPTGPRRSKRSCARARRWR